MRSPVLLTLALIPTMTLSALYSPARATDRPVTASVALLQSLTGLLAEDVTWDPATRTYYVSSVHRRRILAFRETGPPRVFAASCANENW